MKMSLEELEALKDERAERARMMERVSRQQRLLLYILNTYQPDRRVSSRMAGGARQTTGIRASSVTGPAPPTVSQFTLYVGND